MGKNEIKWATAFRDHLKQCVDARNVMALSHDRILYASVCRRMGTRRIS